MAIIEVSTDINISYSSDQMRFDVSRKFRTINIRIKIHPFILNISNLENDGTYYQRY